MTRKDVWFASTVHVQRACGVCDASDIRGTYWPPAHGISGPSHAARRTSSNIYVHTRTLSPVHDAQAHQTMSTMHTNSPWQGAAQLLQGSLYSPYIPCHSYFCSLNQVQCARAIISLTKFTACSKSFPAHLCSLGSDALAGVGTQKGLTEEISVHPSLMAH